MAHISCVGKGLNSGGWERITRVLHGMGHDCHILPHHDEIHEGTDLILLLGHPRLAPMHVLERARRGAILFHSSDLPAGRGWAPIYNTMRRGLDLVQSLCRAAAEADSGAIIAKARYALRGNETEAEVRNLDDRLTLMLLEACLEDILDGRARGVEQDHGAASIWARRHPEDSAVSMDSDMAVSELLDHVRALPENAPAFVDIRGRRFLLRLEPAETGEPFEPARAVLERYYG